MKKSKSIVKSAELEHVGGGIWRQIMGYGEDIMLVKVQFEKGAVANAHKHIHSQSTYIVSGKFEIDMEGEKAIIQEGDGFFVAPNLLHGLVCLEAGTLIDTFSPMREDFI